MSNENDKKDCDEIELNNENKENENKDEEREKISEKTLDDDILKALGNDPTEDNMQQIKLHSSIEKRWKHWFFKGLDEKDKDDLLKKYPSPSGMEPPKLNPEIAAVLIETSLKRDNHFVERQKLAVSALAAIGSAINDLILEDEGIDKAEFIEKLNDAAKLINHFIFDESESRKAFILPGVDREKKKLLEKSNTDEYLFGKELLERVKQAKAIKKVGIDIKHTKETKKVMPLRVKNHLNYKSLQTKKPAYGQAGYANQPGQFRPRLYFKNRQQPTNPRVHQQYRYKNKGPGKVK